MKWLAVLLLVVWRAGEAQHSGRAIVLTPFFGQPKSAHFFQRAGWPRITPLIAALLADHQS